MEESDIVREQEIREGKITELLVYSYDCYTSAKPPLLSRETEVLVSNLRQLLWQHQFGLPDLGLWKQYFSADAEQTALFLTYWKSGTSLRLPRDADTRYRALHNDVIPCWAKQASDVFRNPKILGYSYRRRMEIIGQSYAILLPSTA